MKRYLLAAGLICLTVTAVLAQSLQEATVVEAAFSDFANLHPIVVHLPVVLLPLALISQLAGLFIWQRPMAWVTLAVLLGGVAGAVLAVTLTHPHTHDLPPATLQVLELHDTYANWTLWLGVAALAVRGVALWLAPGRRWADITVALLLAGSTYAVIMAGHYGGTLVYLHGVGVQGNYVEGNSDLDGEDDPAH